MKRAAVVPEMMVHAGPARVFDREEDALKAIFGGKIKPGDVVVIRYEGPKGGPGMREQLLPTSAHHRHGFGQERRPGDRRPIFRGHPGGLRRPRDPGGLPRRPDRPGPGRRQDQNRYSRGERLNWIVPADLLERRKEGLEAPPGVQLPKGSLLERYRRLGGVRRCEGVSWNNISRLT